MSYIKSPLNYTGGKYKLLKNIMPVFPEKIHTFVDLFAGGFNVGINVTADNIICNDHISYLIDIYRYMADIEVDILIEKIKGTIDKYDLSLTNADGYNSLRYDYNACPNLLYLLVLTFYSFNHQIRFNNDHKFNTPFGKERSCYNKNIEQNLKEFCSALQNKNITFENKDFLSIDLSALTSDDLVYCDPPYLISTGSYNDGKRGFKDWTEREELELLDLLDKLDKQEVKFVLSNVLYHKGESNESLIQWSKKYRTIFLDKTYSNCSYHFKDRGAKTLEVLITNLWEALK